MTFQIYCVRDVKTSFMTPTIDQNDASAMRNFRHAILYSDGIMRSSKDDFALYRLGSFDSDSGVIIPLPVPEIIDDGTNVDLGVKTL